MEVRRDQQRSSNFVLHPRDRDSLTSETMTISLCPQKKKEPLIYDTVSFMALQILFSYGDEQKENFSIEQYIRKSMLAIVLPDL